MIEVKSSGSNSNCHSHSNNTTAITYIQYQRPTSPPHPPILLAQHKNSAQTHREDWCVCGLVWLSLTFCRTTSLQLTNQTFSDAWLIHSHMKSNVTMLINLKSTVCVGVFACRLRCWWSVIVCDARSLAGYICINSQSATGHWCCHNNKVFITLQCHHKPLIPTFHLENIWYFDQIWQYVS